MGFHKGRDPFGELEGVAGVVPWIDKNDDTVVVEVADDAADGLVSDANGLLLIPLLPCHPTIILIQIVHL